MTRRQRRVWWWAQQDDVSGYFDEAAREQRQNIEEFEQRFHAWQARHGGSGNREMDALMAKLDREYFDMMYPPEPYSPEPYYDEPMRQSNRLSKFGVHKKLDQSARHRETRRKLRGGPPARLLLTDGSEHRS